MASYSLLCLYICQGPASCEPHGWFDLHPFYFLSQGEFREDNFNTAMQVLRDAGDSGSSSGAKWDPKGRKGGTKGGGGGHHLLPAQPSSPTELRWFCLVPLSCCPFLIENGLHWTHAPPLLIVSHEPPEFFSSGRCGAWHDGQRCACSCAGPFPARYERSVWWLNYGRLHRPFQCLQDRQDDHGKELSASHHLQLQ